jgi:hypothetical protein
VWGYDERRKERHCIRYSWIVQVAPCLFLCGWAWTFGLSICKLTQLRFAFHWL